MKNSKIWVLTFLAFTCLDAYSSTKIGIFLRKEDNYNKFLTSLKGGIEASIKLHPFSRQISIVEVSHDGTPEEIAEAVKKLKSHEVEVVVGGETSSDALQFLRMYQDKSLIFVTPTASTSQLNKYSNYAFRMSHSDKNMYKIVEKVIKSQSLSNISLFHNVTKPNTNSIGKSIQKFLELESIGFNKVEVLSDEILETKKINKFLDMNRSGYISMFTFESDLRKLFEVAKQKNKKLVYIGADGWGSNKSVKKYYIDDQEDKSLFSGIRLMYWVPNKLSESQRKIKSKVSSIIKDDKMNSFHAIGFDSMTVVLDAVAAARKKQSKIGDVLREMSFSNLLTSSLLKFDNEKSALKDLYLYKIDEKGIRFWNQIEISN